MNTPSDAELLCCSQEMLIPLVIWEGNTASKLLMALCFVPLRPCFMSEGVVFWSAKNCPRDVCLWVQVHLCEASFSSHRSLLFSKQGKERSLEKMPALLWAGKQFRVRVATLGLRKQMPLKQLGKLPKGWEPQRSRSTGLPPHPNQRGAILLPDSRNVNF